MATEADLVVGAQLKNRFGTIFTVTARTDTEVTVEFVAPVGGETKTTTYAIAWAVTQFTKVE